MGLRSLSLTFGLALAATVLAAPRLSAQTPAPTVVAPVATQESTRATTQGVSDQMNDKKMGEQKKDDAEKKGQDDTTGGGKK